MNRLRVSVDVTVQEEGDYHNRSNTNLNFDVAVEDYVTKDAFIPRVGATVDEAIRSAIIVANEKMVEKRNSPDPVS